MKILIAEYDEAIKKILISIADSLGLVVHEVENGKSAYQTLEENKDIQLVLMDWEMPGMSGLELASKLRKMEDRFFYIIMLTGNSGTKNLVQAIEAGSDDFISKPFYPEEVRVRLKSGMRVIEQERKLSKLASFDALTQVWNRRMIIKWLHSGWNTAKRHDSRMGVLLFDLDYFKKINDTYGHHCGDEALKLFSERVQGQIRSTDFFGRYGGEEFLLVAPLSDHAELEDLANRIRQDVESAVLTLDSGDRISMTTSIGVTEMSDSDHDAENMLKRADEALCKAKIAGRNTVVRL